MQLADAMAILLVMGAVASFACGALALTRASDIEAVYFLVVGIVALRAGIQVVRSGANA